MHILEQKLNYVGFRHCSNSEAIVVNYEHTTSRHSVTTAVLPTVDLKMLSVKILIFFPFYCIPWAVAPPALPQIRPCADYFWHLTERKIIWIYSGTKSESRVRH